MSALYPAPSPTATGWLSTLRQALAGLAGEVRRVPPVGVKTLATQLETESPEAAELGDTLVATLEEFEPVIRSLSAAFGLFPSTILIALGRGEEIGELDPVVAPVLGRVSEIKTLTSSGTVTIEKDGRSTTLIAATTVAAPTGPIRIAWPDRNDVWLCAVRAEQTPVLTARAALERLLPHSGVQRAHLRTVAAAEGAHGPPRPHRAHSPRSAGGATLHAALLTIDPTADPDLVMARLEGWRAALEQLHRDAVAIRWEQA